MKSTEHKQIEILEQQEVYQGFYHVEKLTVRHQKFEGGWMKPIEREVFVRNDAVGVLLFDPRSSKFVFTEQFRIGPFRASQTTKYPTNKEFSPWIIEIVAGGIEAGETEEMVARREAKEETGLEIKSLWRIGTYWTNPTNNMERITLFCGQVDTEAAQKEAQKVHGAKGESENIKVQILSLETTYQYVKDFDIRSAPTLIALQWFQLNELSIRRQWNT